MKIIINTFAVIIIVLSVFMFVVGCYTTYKAEEYSHFMGFAAYVYNSENPQDSIEVDRLDWKKHWLFVSLFSAFVGLIGVVTAVGVLKKRKKAWIFLISFLLLLLLLNIVLYFGNIYRYEFERTTYIELIIYSLLTIASSWLYRSAKTLKYMK